MTLYIWVALIGFAGILSIVAMEIFAKAYSTEYEKTISNAFHRFEFDVDNAVYKCRQPYGNLYWDGRSSDGVKMGLPATQTKGFLWWKRKIRVIVVLAVTNRPERGHWGAFVMRLVDVLPESEGNPYSFDRLNSD